MMKLFTITVIALSVGSQSFAKDSKGREELTKLAGTPDIIQIEDLNSRHIAIEANGGGFLISLIRDHKKPTPQNRSRK